MRIMGKRQIGQLQPFELAVAIMISELAAVPMQNTGIPLIHGIIPILTLLTAQILLSYISIKSKRANNIICGTPSVIIEYGKIVEANLRKELYSIDDLLEQLRINGTPSIGDVEFAILETNGQLSIFPKTSKRPVNPADLNLQVDFEELPLDLIVDGRVNKENLTKAHVDEKWLIFKLKEFNIDSMDMVLFAYLDSARQFNCQKKGDSR
jgi:uncharacterized membrane protein YcaP (DUF421 family)